MKRKVFLWTLSTVIASGFFLVFLQAIRIPDSRTFSMVSGILLAPLYFLHIPAVVLAGLTHATGSLLEKPITWGVYLTLLGGGYLHPKMRPRLKKLWLLSIVSYIVLMIIVEQIVSVGLNLTLSPSTMVTMD